MLRCPRLSHLLAPGVANVVQIDYHDIRAEHSPIPPENGHFAAPPPAGGEMVR